MIAPSVVRLLLAAVIGAQASPSLVPRESAISCSSEPFLVGNLGRAKDENQRPLLSTSFKGHFKRQVCEIRLHDLQLDRAAHGPDSSKPRRGHLLRTNCDPVARLPSASPPIANRQRREPGPTHS
ncbi:hypothetical protein V8E36_002203 [Tilletia maclaganii]